jgi:HEPN domain-containing protein
LSTHDPHEVAEALLAKARGDEAGLRVLVDHEDVPDHVAGFLAQQAIEKAIKAVLTARGAAYDRSHDLDYLCGLIEDAGLQPTPELRKAVALTPWAVDARYAGPFDAPALDRKDAMQIVSAVLAWAAETIGPRPSN